MTPYEALSIWSAACQKTNVKWFMYKDTLLCANGHQGFPKELAYAQIAVFSQDLQEIFARIFPALPQDWVLAEDEYVMKNHLLCFKQNGVIVLSIDVLFAAKDQHHFIHFTRNTRRLRRRSTIKVMIADFMLGYLAKRKETAFNKFLSKVFRSTRTRASHKAVAALRKLAIKAAPGLLYHYDSLATRKAVMLENRWLENLTEISCTQDDQTCTFPAFSGYREYLEMAYGDYENGLFDEIGCGLTVEEKEQLKLHQEKCREALAFVQKMSQEHNLRYYLLAGSVLGAVRHQGFIPWDDDVDLGIRIEDLEHFEEVIKANLPEGFTLEQSAANHPYPRMFSKICYEGRCCIDLWPLVPTYIDGKKAIFTWHWGRILTKTHYHKIGHKIRSCRKIVRFLSIFLSDEKVMQLARRNERKYANTDTPAYINLYSIYRREKETIRRQWLDTPATAMFDGIEVPVVGCTEEYLTHLYGNYMAFPAPWKRVSRHVARFNTGIE